MTHWWHKFNDPQLTNLVEQGLNVNLDLQLAVARLRQARAARGVVAGALWPAVNGSATYQRTHSTSATSAAAVADDHNLALGGGWEDEPPSGVVLCCG